MKMNVKILFIILLTVSLDCFSQQPQKPKPKPKPKLCKIIGLVKLISSGNTPLENVEVYATNTNSTFTNNKGQFTLEFAEDVKVGEVITRIEFVKQGYIVINEEKARGVVIPEDPTKLDFVITMAKREEHRERAAEYFHIILDKSPNVKGIESTLKEMNSKLDVATITSKEREKLQEQIKEQEDELAKEKSLAAERAEQLAKVDQDQASKLAREAFEAFEKGDIALAIKILDDKKLDDTFNAAQRNLGKAKHEVDQAVDNYMIKARFCLAQQNFEEAEKNFLKAINGDTSSYDNLNEYIGFLYANKKFNQAIVCTNRALKISKDKESSAIMYHYLALLHYQYDDREQALKDAEKCLAIWEELDQGLALYEDNIASIFNVLGLIHQDLGNNEASFKYYQNSSKLYEKYVTYDDSEMEVGQSVLLINLAGYYGQKQEYKKAIETIERALRGFKKYYTNKKLSDEDVLNYAKAFIRAGGIFADSGLFKMSESHYKRGIFIVDSLAPTKSIDFKVFQASFQKTFGDYYFYTRDDKQQALKHYLIASDVLKNIKSLKSAMSAWIEVEFCISISECYADLKLYDKVDLVFARADSALMKLKEEFPTRANKHFIANRYDQSTMCEEAFYETLNENYMKRALDLALKGREIGNRCKTEKAFKDDKSFWSLDSIINIRIKYLESHPINYFKARAYSVKAAALTSKPPQAKRYYQLSETFYKNLISEFPDSTKYRKALARTYRAMLILYVERRDSSLLYVEREIVIREQILLQHPDDSLNRMDLSNAYGNKSFYLLFVKRFKDVQPAVEKALALASNQVWTKTNLAHAYLFLERYEEAIVLYKELKNIPDGNDGKTLGYFMNDDLDQLEKAGIRHKKFAEIKKLLKAQ